MEKKTPFNIWYIADGLESKHRLFNPHEREVVAYHEMGHALIAMSLPGRIQFTGSPSSPTASAPWTRPISDLPKTVT